MIIAVKIFGALEGFRPSALILAKLAAAKTALGPKTHMANIKSNAKLRDILSFFYNYGHGIKNHLYYSPADSKLLAVHDYGAPNHPA